MSNPFFTVVEYRLVTEYGPGRMKFEVTMRVTVHTQRGDETVLEVEEGTGPVDAFSKALRKVLGKFFPEIAQSKQEMPHSDTLGAVVTGSLEGIVSELQKEITLLLSPST